VTLCHYEGMSKEIFRSQFRLPWELYEQLKSSADQSGRSLNAEIIFRLETSFLESSQSSAQQASEMRKAELLLDFETWSNEQSATTNEKARFRDYCNLYNIGDPSSELVEHVSAIDVIDPGYLRELAAAWRRYAMESPYLQGLGDPTKPQRLAMERRKGELVLGYLQWCKSTARDSLSPETLDLFCETYNSDGIPQIRGRIIEIPSISPGYLEDLVKVWVYEVPSRLDETSENNQLTQSINKQHQQQIEKLSTIEEAILRLADDVKGLKP